MRAGQRLFGATHQLYRSDQERKPASQTNLPPDGSIQVSPHRLYSLIIQRMCSTEGGGTSQCDSGFNSSSENTAAIVAEIQIQTLHLPSRLHCLFLHKAAVCRGNRWRRWLVDAGGGILQPYSICRVIRVLAGVWAHARQVLAPSLCSWCLCTRLCQHPPSLLPRVLAPLYRPDTAEVKTT